MGNHTITKKLFLLALVTTALFATSCIKDNVTISKSEEDGRSKVEVSLRLTTPGVSRPSVTKSPTTQAESKIDNVVLLFFSGVGDNAVLYGVSEGRSLENTTDGVNFHASFFVEETDINREFTCLAIANILERDLNNGNKFNVTYLKTQINKLYIKDIPSIFILPIEATGPKEGETIAFPMSGYLDTKLIPSQTTGKVYGAKLLRDLFRVTVCSTDPTFTVTSIYLYSGAGGRVISPLPRNISSDAASVTQCTLPVGVTQYGNGSKYQGVVDAPTAIGTLYGGESNVIMGGTQGDAHHLERTCLVIGGKKNGVGDESFYRVDFANADGLLDLKRNYSYNVNVTRVGSSGETTPDDAYRSRGADIGAEVLEWNDSDIEIVFDGSHWLSMSGRKLEFADGANLQESLKASSDIPFTDWELEFTSGEEWFQAEVTGTQDAQGDWSGMLKVKTKSFNPAYTIYHEQGGEIVYDTSSPAGTDRNGVLLIKCGRLEFVVNLVQHPGWIGNWEDGDNYNNDF